MTGLSTEMTPGDLCTPNIRSSGHSRSSSSLIQKKEKKLLSCGLYYLHAMVIEKRDGGKNVFSGCIFCSTPIIAFQKTVISCLAYSHTPEETYLFTASHNIHIILMLCFMKRPQFLQRCESISHPKQRILPTLPPCLDTPELGLCVLLCFHPYTASVDPTAPMMATSFPTVTERYSFHIYL